MLFLFGLCELAGIADSNGAGEAIGEFDLVELLLDGLPQFDIIDIAQDKQRFDDLADRPSCASEIRPDPVGLPVPLLG